MPDLLIELFSEEIPARMQGAAREALKKLVTDGLVEAGLTYEGAGAFSTPRRLALTVHGLTTESKPVREERKGPRTDAPAAALEGFLRSTGLTLDQLEKRADKKAEVYFAVVEKPGRKAADVVAEVLERTIRNFPWPKSMRWGNGSLRWVRPLHSILCILGDEGGTEVVPLTVEGITAGNTTGGHRFMSPGRFAVSSFDDYAAKLRRAHVMLDSAEREAHIWNDAQNQAFARGFEVVPDAGLLTEVAGLVEWPVVLMGAIGEEFLHLPPEVLQTSMREHQKFFSVKNPKTGRIEGFVTVANRETADHGATILKGNQKVLSARLSDARFFWENDLRVAKSGMTEWAEGLKAVTFHNKLGSQADRIGRMDSLINDLAPFMPSLNVEAAKEAARIAKLDLRSAMVGEFPELQGLMGMYYATSAGQPDDVANAAKEHYQPLGPSDAVPNAPVSVAVALADKLDVLTGFWVIGEKPTGSKDPFALRRAALGVTRLATENALRLPMLKLFAAAAQLHVNQGSTSNSEDVPTDLLAFFHDRLKVFLRDQGIRHDVIDACLAMPGNDDLTLLVKRAEALQAFLSTEDGTNLLQGFKRANNILTQAEQKDGVEYSFGADPKFAETDEERALFAALDAGEAAIKPAMAAEDFAAAMAAMARLRAPIDAFFTAVQINTENQILRRNRLNLLHRIRALVAQVADLTKVEG
ncbi:glycine--tRNA ligase beta subunit [Gemmobacter aquaticus]|uniref:Glycine--tRNA ligase beta subunit n=1 Tax=Gemmobacter aquaticus TaxID=490185 RepID=A0A918DCE8_9RHOB|nr:glycine--tRNA ligase subunit beta [Gemmobacter aquaticus]GGO27504.1 glycine--tRNA ligase beta subunit [Gemmobacter aquaticus]